MSIWSEQEKAILRRHIRSGDRPYTVAQNTSDQIKSELGLNRTVPACYARMRRGEKKGEDVTAISEDAWIKAQPGLNRIQAISKRIVRATHRKLSSGPKAKRILVYGDTHFTFHSQPAIDIMIDIAKDIKPDTIIHNGDVIDCHELSNFDRTEPTEIKLVDEVTAAKEHLATMREAFPDAEFIVNEGNHDFRLIRYIGKNARALFDLPALQIENLLDFGELDITFNRGVAGYSSYHLPHLLVGHFNKVNKWSGYTVKGLLDTLGMSIIQGHVHRLAMVYRTQPTRELVGVEGGCLCSLTPTYMEYADWQQGFCVVTLFPGGEYQVQLVPIVTAGKRMFGIWGSKIYEQKL